MPIGQPSGAAPPPRDMVYFDDSRPDLLVGNGAYEIALKKRAGGPISIVEKATGQRVGNGSLNRCLWSLGGGLSPRRPLAGGRIVRVLSRRGRFLPC